MLAAVSVDDRVKMDNPGIFIRGDIDGARAKAPDQPRLQRVRTGSSSVGYEPRRTVHRSLPRANDDHLGSIVG